MSSPYGTGDPEGNLIRVRDRRNYFRLGRKKNVASGRPLWHLHNCRTQTTFQVKAFSTNEYFHMDAVRAALTAKTKKTDGPRGETTRNNTGYPFWNAPFGSTSTIRFLSEPDSALPWVEKFTVKLPFDGIINSSYATMDPVVVPVISPHTFGQKCPITEAIRPLWKGDQTQVELARQYYRKPAYIFQALVVASAVPDDKSDSPIRLISLNKSLYEIVAAALMEPDYDYAPWDHAHGRDFRIIKSQQGHWANYSRSSFAPKERALTDQERAAIDQHGLRDLQAELGTPPDAAQLGALRELFQDSMDGQPFDEAKYSPFGFRAFRNSRDAYSTGNGGGNGTPVPAPAPVSAPLIETGTLASSTDELLANLRIKAKANRAAI